MGAMSSHTFVLVPGAGGAAWYWHRVVAGLESRGHEAVPVELPAGDDSAGLGDYAGVIRDAIDGRKGVVLVAQSMGGFSAPLVIDDQSIALIVLVNAMIPSPGESGGGWWENTGQAEAQAQYAARHGRDATDDLTDLFFHDVPADVTAEAMRQGEPPQSETPFIEPWPLVAWPDIPTRVLVGRDDRLFPADFQRRVALERLGVDAEEIRGGHLVALSNPVDVAEALIRYADQD